MTSIMQRLLDDGLHVRPKSVLYTNAVETATKHFKPSFVKPSHFESYIVICFALV